MLPHAQFGPLVSATGRIGGACLYRGASIVSTADAEADVSLYDGTSNAGRLLDVFKFGTFGSDHHWMADTGVWCEQGIFMGAITGALTGVIYFNPIEVVGGEMYVIFGQSDRIVRKLMTQVDIDGIFESIREGH